MSYMVARLLIKPHGRSPIDMNSPITKLFLTLFLLLHLVSAQEQAENMPAKSTALVSETVPSPEINESMVLRPSDQIVLMLLEDPDVHYEGPVSESGAIVIPYLGEFRVAGMTSEQASTAIGKALIETLYQKATVSLQVTGRSPGRIFVYGAVKTPGQIDLEWHQPLTLVQAISQSGGLTSYADANACYVIRMVDDERIRKPVNVINAYGDIGGPDDIMLMNGDVLFVPTANRAAQPVLTSEPSEVIVVGEVNNPGIILFAPGETKTIMRAIFKAGNFSRFAKSKDVRLIRQANGKRDVQVINVEEIIQEGKLDKDIGLQAGDMVIVDQKMFSFQ